MTILTSEPLRDLQTPEGKEQKPNQNYKTVITGTVPNLFESGPSDNIIQQRDTKEQTTSAFAYFTGMNS